MKDGLREVLAEKETEEEELRRKAEDLKRDKEGKSAKTAVLSKNYWEDYSLRTDSWSKTVYQIHLMLSSTKFDAAIGVVILINSVLIGVQTEAELDKQVGLVQTLVIIDNVFLAIYTVEISSRFIAYGTRCLDN